jgi:AcrR family transcriptional regulator
MTDEVKTRRYDSSRRQTAAAERRRRILEAASVLFRTDGYGATTVAAIAERAGVAPDTVYASVGPKPRLFRELVEMALSGTTHPVEGQDRDYAVRMRAEPSAAAKLAVYAEAVTALQGRVAPLFLVLREAAAAHPELDTMWRGITERRARNMRMLAADLAQTGALRPDLTVDEVADVVWTMNSSEYYAMLVLDRGWTPERFARWLHDAWCRLLLRDQDRP